jgi:hypothetical protein
MSMLELPPELLIQILLNLDPLIILRCAAVNIPKTSLTPSLTPNLGLQGLQGPHPQLPETSIQGRTCVRWDGRCPTLGWWRCHVHG